jgi:hypothetical protein
MLCCVVEQLDKKCDLVVGMAGALFLNVQKV